jgi:hypothetical protein
MEPNGMLYSDYPDEICFCRHKSSRHLDQYGICLHGLCICDSFRNKNKGWEDQSVGKKKKQQEVDVQEDLFDFIHQL